MLLVNNVNLKLIKYQGTCSFIAGLFQDKVDEKYYFGFFPTDEPALSITNNGEYAYDKFEVPLLMIDNYQAIFEVKGRTFGKDKKLFYLLLIKPEEFDSLYKLLECIYDD